MRDAIKVAILLLALAPLAACATTGSTTGEGPTPADTEAVDKDTPAPPPKDLTYCEELFATLNQLGASALTDARRVSVEAHAREEAEVCREIFVASSETPGSKVVGHAFADIMLLRSYELRMDRRQQDQDTTGVCADSRDALARMRANLQRVDDALTTLELRTDEEAVLSQVRGAMVQKIDALEPFVSRGCKGDDFDPKRLISVSDLAVSPTMTWDACYAIIVAFSAFDMEVAEQAEIHKLIALLDEANAPCKVAFGASRAPTSLEALNGRSYAALLEGAPLLVKTSLALAEDRTIDACTAMDGFLKISSRRVEMLETLVTQSGTDAEVRTRAAIELETESGAQEQIRETYRALCGL